MLSSCVWLMVLFGNKVMFRLVLGMMLVCVRCSMLVSVCCRWVMKLFNWCWWWISLKVMNLLLLKCVIILFLLILVLRWWFSLDSSWLFMLWLKVLLIFLNLLRLMLIMVICCWFGCRVDMILLSCFRKCMWLGRLVMVLWCVMKRIFLLVFSCLVWLWVILVKFSRWLFFW